MSAIQARIRAFETLGNDTPPKPTARKSPVKLYDNPGEEANADMTNMTQSVDSDPLAKTETLPIRPIQPIRANTNDSADGGDNSHSFVIGSITSDFVKVSPPRSRPPPLPPRNSSGNSANSANSASNPGASNPGTPEGEKRGSTDYSPGTIKKGSQTPRPIPQKMKVQGFDSSSDGGFGSSLSVYPRNGRGHMPATSTSSFHSVSLSDPDHGGDMEHEGLGGSYEAVSPHSSSVFSLLEKSSSLASSPALSAASLQPPALPPRPSSISSGPTPLSHHAALASDSSQRSVPYAVRKAPPPPPSGAKAVAGKSTSKPPPLDMFPQRSLARSSLASISTTASSSSVSSFSTSYNDKRSSRASVSTINSNLNNTQTLAKKRLPPPLPPAARSRYEALFDANIQAQRTRRKNNRQSLKPGPHSRRAVGWRGVSVDLTTTGPESLIDDDTLFNQKTPDEEVDEDERLSGQVVKLIWSCSKLPKKSLQAIWNECDPAKKGALDRQSFVNGMWRIDNELLAAASLHMSTSARGAYRNSSIRR